MKCTKFYVKGINISQFCIIIDAPFCLGYGLVCNATVVPKLIMYQALQCCIPKNHNQQLHYVLYFGSV
jgi:hypothetical protein